MLPNSRPQRKREELLSQIPKPVDPKYPLYVVGVRGYYTDSMGVKGKNDRAIYDDAIFVVSPKVFQSFNGNTDPSAQFKKGLAMLKPDTYYAHKIGAHKGYQALAQWAGKVTVARDGVGDDTGFFGINIHRGGVTTTSSEGCQTIPPAQWKEFIELVVSEAKRIYGKDWSKVTIPYVLFEEPKEQAV